MNNFLQSAREGARLFRKKFLGKKARSQKTGAEGVIIGGYIDASSVSFGISGSFELQTADGIERNLLINDLVFLEVEEPKSIEAAGL